MYVVISERGAPGQTLDGSDKLDILEPDTDSGDALSICGRLYLGITRWRHGCCGRALRAMVLVVRVGVSGGMPWWRG